MKDAVLGLIRHAMTFGGGYLVSEGLATGDEVSAAISGAVAIGGLVWSIVKNRKKA